MRWYEDDELWSRFAEVIFAEDRATQVADAVACSPLFRFAPGARVLDQCCGPALFARPLARQGYAVTGVDLSAVMLADADEVCAAAGVPVELVRADVREFVRPAAFDVVINTHTSFGYFDDPAENLRVLRNARDCLAPDGVLLVDVLGKEIYARTAGGTRAVPVEGGVVFISDTVHADFTRFRTEWTLVRGATVHHTALTLWVYSAAELRDLFHAAGFVDVECFGDFSGGPYDDTAERLVVRGVRGS